MFKLLCFFLFYNRATYLLESGDAEAALKDVNRAICLNNQYAPAYSLRAKLRMQEIAEQEQADEEEEEEEKNEGTVATEGEKEGAKVEALQHAAEDALLGKCFSFLFFFSSFPFILIGNLTAECT